MYFILLRLVFRLVMGKKLTNLTKDIKFMYERVKFLDEPRKSTEYRRENGYTVR